MWKRIDWEAVKRFFRIKPAKEWHWEVYQQVALRVRTDVNDEKAIFAEGRYYKWQYPFWQNQESGAKIKQAELSAYAEMLLLQELESAEISRAEFVKVTVRLNMWDGIYSVTYSNNSEWFIEEQAEKHGRVGSLS